ncbi:PAS domain-containing hybrid sensor histidine kinase/response regulator [Aurantiacibacter marinus]|uniref:PAS domain-containing hybrid sensor histidine kinase/response regulator n=1 Tax=Aurantiacibacter marinus TaxID=874156 RepID=UPI00069A7BEB|nr:ATP-binding protein [Aurantiacibacter marinus]
MMTMLDTLFLILALAAAGVFAALYLRARKAARHEDLAALSFYTLTQVAPAGIWRTDPEGNALFVNATWEEMTGMGEKAWSGSGWSQALHPDDKSRVFSNFMRAVANHEKFEDEWRWKRPDGSPFWVKGLGAPEYDERGELIGYVGINIDIQRSKELEQELVKARDSAEKEAASKSTFLANMSHDIRTPMNGVIGFTELLLETDLDEDQRGHVQLIADSGRAMMQLLNDILDHAKIASGQLSLVMEPTDLRQRLAHCAKLVEPIARSKGLSISVWVDDTVPQHVKLDQLRIGQIMLNLVGNAVKFTQAGGIDIEARMENSSEGRSLLISVIDTGIGIDEARLEDIFSEFVQEDGSTARDYGGTGLGLAISSQLVTLMGGRISVHSKRGVGTQFTVRLPLLATKAVNKVDAQPPSMSDADVVSCLSGAHVLIAEDHGINQELILAMTNTLRLDAHLVENGEEAVSAVVEADKAGVPFKAILMDLQMPEVDGLEATRRLRAIGYDGEKLPIIALTANCYPDDIAACTAAGMQSHLGKPVTTVALARELARWLTPDRGEKVTEPGDQAYLLHENLPAMSPASSMPALEDRYRNRKVEIVSSLRQLLDSTAEQTDWEELAGKLHKLAGVAANFGEPELGEASRRLERWLTTSREPEELLVALRREWPHFEKAA